MTGTATEIRSIKGFDSDWTCRGFQFEVGKTYEHDGPVDVCVAGFHACDATQHPFFVFYYYPPAGARYADVVQSGAMDRENDGAKIASARITIEAEVKLSDLIRRAVDWVFAQATPTKGGCSTGDYGAASSTGDYGAASSTGHSGAASSTGTRGAASSTGTRGAASSTGHSGAASSTGHSGAASSTGYYGAASSTGYYGAASSTGDYGAASSTGHYGAASSTGIRGAASSTGHSGAASSTGTRGAASSTGHYGAASSTGTRGAASSTGHYGAASSTGHSGAASSTGDSGAAMAIGYQGRVMGANGNALFLCRRNDNGDITHVWAGIVGRDRVKPETWYSLDKNGAPQEAAP